MTGRFRPDELMLAVDGGGSKTDVWLLSTEGAVVGVARGGGSNHQLSGLEGAMDALRATVEAATEMAGLDAAARPIAARGMFCMAGLDLPVDEERLSGAIVSRGWVSDPGVVNDTLAVLRAGARTGWGVGVVCGSGLNCIGRGPDGTTVRFPSLGELSGDLAAGGSWLGVRALGLALRSRDGRGAPTRLADLVAAHFDRRDPESVLVDVYTGDLNYGRLFELAQVCVEAAADGDEVASLAVGELADEVAAMIIASAQRLGVVEQPVEVVLGGGLFDTRYPGFAARIEARVGAVVPEARWRRLEAAPVLGAALLALDAVGAPEEVKRSLRSSVVSGSPGPG